MGEHIEQQPVIDPEQLAAAQAKIAAYEGHKSFGEGYFQKRFGLAAEDLTKQITYGDFEGSFVDALVPDDPERLLAISQMPKDDPARRGVCPMGGIVENAYINGGHDGVQNVLNAYSLTDANFKLTLSEASRNVKPLAATLAIGGLKKKTPSS